MLIKKGTKRLVKIEKYNYQTKLTKCAMMQPKKYYAYIQLRDGTAPLSVDGSSAVVDGVGEAKALSDRFSSVHRADAGLDKESDGFL